MIGTKGTPRDKGQDINYKGYESFKMIPTMKAKVISMDFIRFSSACLLVHT